MARDFVLYADSSLDTPSQANVRIRRAIDCTAIWVPPVARTRHLLERTTTASSCLIVMGLGLMRGVVRKARGTLNVEAERRVLV